MRLILVTIALAGALSCTSPATPTHTPPPSVSIPSGPPPAPHRDGEPHGLGVTPQMVVDALLPMGFAFEASFNETVQRPHFVGHTSLGPQFTVWVTGSPPGVIEFALLTSWTRNSQPPIAAIRTIVELVTPLWEGASDWVEVQVNALAGQDDAESETYNGNYAVRVSAHLLGFAPEVESIQVSISPRFASCADALASQDWTIKGSVGNERGYAGWRVPLEPDPDGDKTVCEDIPL